MIRETPNQGAAEEVAGIRHALHVFLTVATDEGLKRRFTLPRKERELRSFSFGELMKLVDSTEAEGKVAELIRDPLGEAVRSSVRVLGERLHEIGGMKLMSTMLDEVAELDPANRSRRETIMDRRWDGIGGWAS